MDPKDNSTNSPSDEQQNTTPSTDVTSATPEINVDLQDASSAQSDGHASVEPGEQPVTDPTVSAAGAAPAGVSSEDFPSLASESPADQLATSSVTPPDPVESAPASTPAPAQSQGDADPAPGSNGPVPAPTDPVEGAPLPTQPDDVPTATTSPSAVPSSTDVAPVPAHPGTNKTLLIAGIAAAVVIVAALLLFVI
ncbi:MAG TPA: hypothetical protein VF733_03690 [Candidatus Saccharimonadales bacterium]